MQNHVPTLENCLALDKALKAKGMKPMETMFWWNTRHIWLDYVKNINDFTDCVPAPLSSELGERLGKFLDAGVDKNLPTELQCSVSEFLTPDYLAKLYTYLINEGLIS